MNPIANQIIRSLISSATRNRAGFRQRGPRHGSSYRARSIGRLISLIIFAIVSGVFAWSKGSAPWLNGGMPTSTLTGRVERVVDGDTFYLQGYSIRVWGINAPERGERGYLEATRALQNLVTRREMSCTPVGTNHDRVVAACTADQRIDISARMVQMGWAKDLPDKSGGRFASLEREARLAKRGIWGI